MDIGAVDNKGKTKGKGKEGKSNRDKNNAGQDWSKWNDSSKGKNGKSGDKGKESKEKEKGRMTTREKDKERTRIKTEKEKESQTQMLELWQIWPHCKELLVENQQCGQRREGITAEHCAASVLNRRIKHSWRCVR